MYALLSLTHLWNFISISSLVFLRPPKLLRQQSTAVKTAQFDHGKQFLFLIYCWPPKPLSQQSTVIKTARFDHGEANVCLNSLFYFVRRQNLSVSKARWSTRRDLTTGGQIDHGISQMRTPPTVVNTARFDHGINGRRAFDHDLAHLRESNSVAIVPFMKETVVKTARCDHRK